MECLLQRTQFQIPLAFLLFCIFACNSTGNGSGESQRKTPDSSSSSQPKIDAHETKQASIVGTCKEETDKVTGKTNLAFAEPITATEDGRSGIQLYGLLGSKRTSMILLFKGAEAGFACVDDDDVMYILFRDSSRLQLENDGKFDCEGTFTEYFGDVFGKKKALDELSSKEIDVIRLTSRKGSVEKSLSAEQSKQFLESIACLKAGMK